MIFCGCRNKVSSHFKIPELCSGQYGAWLSCHTRGGGTGPLGEPAMHFTCTWGAAQVSLRSHALPLRGEIELPCLGTVAGGWGDVQVALSMSPPSLSIFWGFTFYHKIHGKFSVSLLDSCANF